MTNIASENIKTLTKNFLKEYVDEKSEVAFEKGMQIGIENTVAALYDANVSEAEIIRVMNVHWGVNRKGAIERILYEKTSATKRSLREYLKLNGYSQKEINDFWRKTRAVTRINHEKELWEYRRNPDKLFEILQQNNE